MRDRRKKRQDSSEKKERTIMRDRWENKNGAIFIN
jgi:hypothetical protein